MKTEEIHIMIGPHEPLELESYISAVFFKDIFILEIGPRQSVLSTLWASYNVETKNLGEGRAVKSLRPPPTPHVPARIN